MQARSERIDILVLSCRSYRCDQESRTQLVQIFTELIMRAEKVSDLLTVW